MKAPLSLAACLVLTCHVAGAAEQAASAEPRWLTDADGCKFLSPISPNAPSVTIEWTGQCVDGFVSGPGEVRLGPVAAYRGEFAQGRIVKGSVENSGDALYEGEFLDNLPHGQGVARSIDGATTRTTFHRGRAAGGYAEITWTDKTRYRGETQPRTRYMHGKGILEYSDGTVYEGEFQENYVTGVGVMQRPNGEVRRGTFVAGKLEGNGSVLYANQARYEGELRADQPSGQGRMEFADGSLYEGAFVAGSYQGQGKLSYAGGAAYEGEFLAGNPSGSGTMSYADGSRYVGQFLYGRRHGTGQLTHATGHVEEGEWKGGVLSGKCRVAKNDIVYDGQCVDGKATGFGRLDDKPKNLVYEGEFVRDQFEGKGTLKSGDVVYEGAFKGGLMEGPGELKIGKLTLRGEFKAGFLHRGTISNDERTFEIDVETDEVLEVMKDGSKLPIDELPAEVTI